jgi:hypothetical protein
MNLLLEEFPKTIMDYFPWLHELIPRQVSNARPPLRNRSSENLIDDVKLMNFVVPLEHWLLSEQL